MKTLSTSLKSKAGLVGISIYMVIALGMIFNIKALDAQPTDPFTKITDDNFAETIPVIEGDYIVYSRKNIAKENGIYLYHIPTGDTISIMKCNHGNFTHIDMSGDRIVWQQYENDSWDIYNYLISRPDLGAYPLIDFEGDQESPAIDGDILVYINANGVPFSSNLFMYDIADARLTQITTDDDMQQWQPDVYGNYIVWASTHGNGDIFMYNIYKEEIIRITDDDARQRNPTIYKKHIVWEDQRRGNWDLYLTYLDYHYDIEPTKAHWPVWTGNIGELNSWSQVNAKISDNYIIYQDNRNYNWDLRLYTFINPIAGSSQVLIEEVEGQIDPSIWENKVVWTDERENSETYFYKTNLWMWEKPPGVDLSVSIEDQPDPVPLGSQLSYLVYVSNFGDQSAYNPDFTFNLPAGVDFVSMDGFGSGGYSRTADQVFCKLDSIPAHTTDTVTIIVTPVVEGEIIGNAIIEAVEEDIESLNNTASCKTKVIWKIPTMVDNGGSASVVVDRLGRPHFTYLSNEYGGQVIYSTFQHGILQRLVIDSSEYNCSPSIAVDSKGNLHLAYGKGDQEWDEEKNLVYRNIKNGILSEPEVLTSSAGTANNVTIKVDTKDSLHISFMTSLWSDGNIWYYKKSGQWSSAMIKAGSYNSSSFDIDTSGYAHFSYYDLSSLGLTYRTNSPDGILKAEESPDGDWHGGQMESLVCDIAVDHLSRPHVSYVGSVQDWQNEDYKYAMKSGSSWGKELLEDGDFAGADNAIDTDPAGNPHICFYNPLNGRLKYHYKEQGTWHKRIIDFPEYWNPGTRMMDICVDHLGYSHILYTTKNEILYVTNTIPIPEPEITVFPQILDFSARLVGDTTDAKRVNIVNTGEADLVISDISLVWRDSANFSISEFDCDILTPGDTCHVDVRFNPEIIGNKHAMLWITSNDPLNPEEGVSLKGEGLQGILWDYGSQDFGEVNLGDSVVNEYYLKNKGNTNLVVQGIYIENGNVDDFYYRDFPEPSFSIPAGDSVVFNLVFKPVEEGPRSVLLKIYSTGGSLTRTLSGTGVLPTYSIEGEIRLPDNGLADQGNIIVWNMDENSPYPIWWYKPLEGAESFKFVNLPQVNFTLRFDPDEASYPGYLKTYLGDTPYMEDAVVYLLDQDIDEVVIHLLEAPLPGPGTGVVSGSLFEEGGKKTGLKLKSGNYDGDGVPLENVSVYLCDMAGEITHSDVSDSNGEFDFVSISQGNYLLKVDYNAIPMDDQNDTLKVTEENQEFEILAIISESKISCGITNLSTSTGIWESVNLNVYPNPFADKLYLELNTFNNEDLIFEVYDLSGRCILNGIRKRSSFPEEKFQLDTKKMKEGYYLMKLRLGEQELNLKLLKIR